MRKASLGGHSRHTRIRISLIVYIELSQYIRTLCIQRVRTKHAGVCSDWQSLLDLQHSGQYISSARRFQCENFWPTTLRVATLTSSLSVYYYYHTAGATTACATATFAAAAATTTTTPTTLVLLLLRLLLSEAHLFEPIISSCATIISSSARASDASSCRQPRRLAAPSE